MDISNQKIEEEAQGKYIKNLLYFQQNHFDLYEKIMAFETALQKGYYDAKYELEYKEEGYFDVIETKSGKWLYGMNSNKHADIIAKNIDFSKKENLFETFRDIKFSEERVKKYESMPLTQSSLSTIAPIVYYTNQFASKSTTMKKIYKFIFIGTGLGLHIKKIHEKLHSNTYFIVEDDLELFYLSLFVTDYEELTKDGAVLIFSIFDNEENFRYKSYAFLREMFVYNHYLKYFLLLSHSTEKLKILHSAIISQDYLKFPHSAVLQVYLRPLEYLKNRFKFINLNEVAKHSPLQEHPLLILAAGPSLQADIEWVKQNQKKFIVVAVTAAMGLLEKENIKPDIIMHVDGFEASMKHLEKVQSMSFFDNSLALFASFTYPQFAKAFNKKNVYIFQAATSIKKDFGQMTASNVGIMAYSLALYFKSRDIYTLGLDMALDPKTGTTHSSGHLHYKQLDVNHHLDLEENIDYNETVLHTKGNFLDEVPTTPHFVSALMELKGIAQQFQSCEQKIYNLSNGAYLHNTTPLKPDEANLSSFHEIDKISLHQNIKECFKKASSIGLSDEEIKRITQRINYAKNILELITSFQHLKFNSMDQYHYDLLGLFIDILAEDSRDDAADANGVISIYIQMVSGYIFDFINTKEIDNPKRHIKKLNKILMTQLVKLVSYYENYLKDFLDEAIEERPGA